MWDWSQNEDDVGLLEEATPVVARYGQQQWARDRSKRPVGGSPWPATASAKTPWQRRGRGGTRASVGQLEKATPPQEHDEDHQVRKKVGRSSTVPRTWPSRTAAITSRSLNEAKVATEPVGTRTPPLPLSIRMHVPFFICLTIDANPLLLSICAARNIHQPEIQLTCTTATRKTVWWLTLPDVGYVTCSDRRSASARFSIDSCGALAWVHSAAKPLAYCYFSHTSLNWWKHIFCLHKCYSLLTLFQKSIRDNSLCSKSNIYFTNDDFFSYSCMRFWKFQVHRWLQNSIKLYLNYKMNALSKLYETQLLICTMPALGYSIYRATCSI
jgi:hypothetical protein